MERSKEVREWSLSKSKGWVHLSDLYYTDEKPTVCNALPDDTVLRLTCYSAGSKDCPNTKDETKIGTDEEIRVAKEKFGDMPQDPYM